MTTDQIKLWEHFIEECKNANDHTPNVPDSKTREAVLQANAALIFYQGKWNSR